VSIFGDRGVRSFALVSCAWWAASFASACGSSEPAREAAPEASANPALPSQEITPEGAPASSQQPEPELQPEATPGGAEMPAAELPLGDAPSQAPASSAPVTPTRETPAPPAPPPVDSTHGSGGPTGAASLTSAGGLSYLIDAPAAAGPHGLLVLLHGSTASNYTTFIGMMREVSRRYDLIPVSVLAPNGQGWNEGNQVRAAELLHRLVQEDLFPQYDIDKARVLFSGQSSGGGFLSSNFIPAHAADYRGGAFLQCGAAPPNIAFMPSAETRQGFRLHFEITTGDPIWPDSYAAALRAYGNAQMQFTMDNTKPGGHCQFDQQQVILDHIAFVLDQAAPQP
jgi:predicted esterase